MCSSLASSELSIIPDYLSYTAKMMVVETVLELQTLIVLMIAAAEVIN